ncbi:MAG: hypothetical protein HC888_16210 [Candidatus Competibacteraceae bacterium]|nr:hypothetical protein [Candidatus Competibacteraceae bacterium]
MTTVREDAAATESECLSFIRSFARVNVSLIRREHSKAITSSESLGEGGVFNWDDPDSLRLSGVHPGWVDDEVRMGRRYLHIDAAVKADAQSTRRAFLARTGLSEKQQRQLFPVLTSSRCHNFERRLISREVGELNDWLEWVGREWFRLQRLYPDTRRISASMDDGKMEARFNRRTGAAIAFVDAIESLDSTAIIDRDGDLPPVTLRSPEEIFNWRESVESTNKKGLRSLLLRNGRAVVFASSKDANIFEHLGGNDVSTATEAMTVFNAVRNDQRARSQVLHEYAVGEIKTATDTSNLHERMGLASRETQTELRTDRFLMMAILNRDILQGGVQGRTMNNRDVRRFTHVFNLHHCWGWDGGRDRNQVHWRHFLESVRFWCGL